MEISENENHKMLCYATNKLCVQILADDACVVWKKCAKTFSVAAEVAKAQLRTQRLYNISTEIARYNLI